LIIDHAVVACLYVFMLLYVIQLIVCSCVGVCMLLVWCTDRIAYVLVCVRIVFLCYVCLVLYCVIMYCIYSV